MLYSSTAMALFRCPLWNPPPSTFIVDFRTRYWLRILWAEILGTLQPRESEDDEGKLSTRNKGCEKHLWRCLGQSVATRLKYGSETADGWCWFHQPRSEFNQAKHPITVGERKLKLATGAVPRDLNKTRKVFRSVTWGEPKLPIYFAATIWLKSSALNISWYFSKWSIFKTMGFSTNTIIIGWFGDATILYKNH